MTIRQRHELLTALIAFLAVTSQAANSDAPRLVVQIAIDQLRADFVETYSQQYSEGGLRRMLQNGRVYSNASYPFAPLDRASAVATLSTGTTPFYNGIVGCQWIDRQTMRPTWCEDGTAAMINCSTIGDELKMRTKGKALVYSVAPQSEEAVMMAGHAADGALWIDRKTGHWATNAYYPKGGEQLSAYSTKRSLLKSLLGQKDLNEEVTTMALTCMERAGLGKDATTDYLAVTYEAGSDAQSYKRLDKQLERLFTEIEKQVKATDVLYTLTSTGYADEEALDYAPYRVPTGTFSMQRSSNLLNMYLAAIYGQGHYVETTFGNEIFLNLKLFDEKKINIKEALERSQNILLQMSGVRNVYTSSQLATVAASAQAGMAALDKIKAGYAAERRGDIIIEIAPGWKLVDEQRNEERTQLFSDIGFPIIIMGEGFEPSVVTTPVTTDRIAPTICRAIRIRAPNASKATPLP